MVDCMLVAHRIMIGIHIILYVQIMLPSDEEN